MRFSYGLVLLLFVLHAPQFRSKETASAATSYKSTVVGLIRGATSILDRFVELQ